jgi:hypothetical protein
MTVVESAIKRLALGLSLLALGAAVAVPDTIVQTNAGGQREVIQANAIVIQQNQYAISYKHFDLKRRMIVKVNLQQGSLPYRAVVSSAGERQGILSVWKAFGYTTRVTTQAGKTTMVYDAYLDFFPPAAVGSFMEIVPPRTNLPIQLANGGVDEIEFSKILKIENTAGRLTVTLTNGRVETGTFLMPTSEPAVVHFMGLTDSYTPASPQVFNFSLPLSAVKEIQFIQNNG